MTSIHRPCRSAIARASSARTTGLTSLAARFDRVRAMFAPSPMISPRSAAVVSAAASAPGAMRISSSRTGGARLDVVAVDRPRVVGALDDAARDELGGGRRVAAERVGERGQPDREALDGPAAEPPLGRGRDPDDDLAIERRRVAEADDEQPARRELAAGARARSRSACRSARRTRRAPGARRRRAGRARRAGRRRRARGDGDDEDVGGHVPRLVGDDTKLHGCRVLRKGAAERRRGVARRRAGRWPPV